MDRDERLDVLVEGLREAGELHSDEGERALRAVPRHEFVPRDLRHRAYEDEPLEIGQDQVVTAPHLVARMTELLQLAPGQSVLEVGTGSGYHAAVIAELVGATHLLSIERHQSLATRARRAVARTGYGDVTVVVGDGSCGLASHAPYDRINVTCACPHVPDPLVEQLSPDGRMVVPTGHDHHVLELVRKRDGSVERTTHGRVRFVPLVGQCGFDTPP